LFEAVVFERNAALPIATLFEPVVLKRNAESVPSNPPTATFFSPVVFDFKQYHAVIFAFNLGSGDPSNL
jgi:hypothetical protein